MKMNQRERIKNYMLDWGSITPYEAFRDLGITKLATRISEMVKAGEEIEKTMVSDTNRYGEPVHYMRYSMGVKK